jgi:flavin-binding protein dodecin
MSVAKVIEISASSPDGFEAAIRAGIARAAQTVKHIKSAWVKEQTVEVAGDRVVGYRVNLMVTFLLED